MSELINKVVTKHEIRGEVQIKKVYPELENLTVTPTKELQSFNHPDSYGYNNVVVKAIDCKTLSVIPQKEKQAFDGMYDKVNVSAIDCETLNIIPKRENQSFDGMYDKVNVDAVVGDTLNIKPSSAAQTFNGLYETVNVEKVQGSTLSVTPKEAEQSFNGLYDNVNVGAIETEEVTIDPDFSTQNAVVITATEGKYIKKATVNKDANLVAENILEGKVICGIGGTGRNGVDTSDATATPEKVLKGETFYANGEKQVGTMEVSSSGERNATVIAMAGFNLRKAIKEVDLTGLSLSITSAGAFQSCENLEIVKGLDCSSSTTLYNGFESCYKLYDLDINNTQKVANFQYAFKLNSALQTLKELRGDKINNIASCFQSCSNLTNFGGFLNLGKSYTSTSANLSSYMLDLSPCTKLTHDSLMNVINGLYDLNLTYKVADGGTLYRQTLKLGSTNLAKLTADEIAIATNKGWNVS